MRILEFAISNLQLATTTTAQRLGDFEIMVFTKYQVRGQHLTAKPTGRSPERLDLKFLPSVTASCPSPEWKWNDFRHLPIPLRYRPLSFLCL